MHVPETLTVERAERPAPTARGTVDSSMARKPEAVNNHLPIEDRACVFLS